MYFLQSNNDGAWICCSLCVQTLSFQMCYCMCWFFLNLLDFAEFSNTYCISDMYIVCKPLKFVVNLHFLHTTQRQVLVTSTSQLVQIFQLTIIIGEIHTLCLWLRVEEEDEQFSFQVGHLRIVYEHSKCYCRLEQHIKCFMCFQTLLVYLMFPGIKPQCKC